MADRQFNCPVAHPTEVPASMLPVATKWHALAHKWRALAERRSAHHVEMFYSGRWKHYYTDEEFLLVMRSAILMARRWTAIAPDRHKPEDAVGPAELQVPKVA